jgi:virulence-associated protein VagC
MNIKINEHDFEPTMYQLMIRWHEISHIIILKCEREFVLYPKSQKIEYWVLKDDFKEGIM